MSFDLSLSSIDFFYFSSPSNQWQDSVSFMLNKLCSPTSDRRSDIRPELQTEDDNAPIRRQRRRVGDKDYSFQQHSSTSTPGSAVPKDSTRLSTSQEAYLSDIAYISSPLRNWDPSLDDSMTSGSEDELTGAVGQLSLNEDEQVRYHGKASGLYLLDNKERVDSRNEGGIWLIFLLSFSCSLSLIVFLF